MKPGATNNKLSLAQCRKILNKKTEQYTDDEAIKIRDWLHNFNAFALEFLEENNIKNLSELKEFMKKKGTP